LRRRSHVRAATLHSLEQGAAAILPQMPAVGHLDGLGRAAAGGIGKAATAIPADNLGSRMLSEPANQRVSISVWEEIDNAMLLEIDQDGPVVVATTPGPLINAEHTRRSAGACRCPAPEHVEQCRGTDRHGKTVCQA
jgi:hypothetical protein